MPATLPAASYREIAAREAAVTRRTKALVDLLYAWGGWRPVHELVATVQRAVPCPATHHPEQECPECALATYSMGNDRHVSDWSITPEHSHTRIRLAELGLLRKLPSSLVVTPLAEALDAYLRLQAQKSLSVHDRVEMLYMVAQDEHPVACVKCWPIEHRRGEHAAGWAASLKLSSLFCQLCSGSPGGLLRPAWAARTIKVLGFLYNGSPTLDELAAELGTLWPKNRR